MTAKPSRRVLERIREQRAALERDYSFAERLEAARALGLADWMPEPQEEMQFNEGERNDRSSAG